MAHKKLKNCIQKLMNTPIDNDEVRDKLISLGFSERDITFRLGMAYALCSKALASGDVSAYKEIRNTLGEDNSSADEVLKKLDNVLNSIKGVI
ncbi:MAG: hypothetical protein E7415_05915 [Ruminococcaceae bacterium]|nr:hypothetical protein [Oscillospiraceae bacterium]